MGLDYVRDKETGNHIFSIDPKTGKVFDPTKNNEHVGNLKDGNIYDLQGNFLRGIKREDLYPPQPRHF